MKKRMKKPFCILLCRTARFLLLWVQLATRQAREPPGKIIHPTKELPSQPRIFRAFQNYAAL